MDEHMEQKNNKKKRGWISRPMYYALVAIFAAVFLLAGIYLGGYYWETSQAEQDYDALASIYQQGVQTIPSITIPGSTGATPGETQPLTILPELQPIYELNNQLVGYLSFPYSTLNLCYPVMQCPEDSDYYLDHDFYGQESIAGCPYVPTTCDVFKPSDNVVIYGHNLRTGGMFNKLTKYKEESFWKEHQTFTFDTLYERHTYQIFAVFKTAAAQYKNDGTPWGYPYHRMNEFTTRDAFDKFVADIKGAAFTSGKYQGYSFYDTGITPEYGDKLLCLSTCEYSMKDPDGTINGRLVIFAVRVD